MDLKDLKGIGEKTERLFEKIGIYEVSDLITYYPHTYIKYDKVKPIAELREGETCAVKAIVDSEPKILDINGLKMLVVTVRDISARMQITYFNANFMKNTLKLGSIHIFYGKVRTYREKLSLNQPKIFKVSEYEEKLGHLYPVYSQTKGLSNAVIEKAIRQAFTILSSEDTRDSDFKNIVEEYIPRDIYDRRKLKPMLSSIRSIHFPSSLEEYEEARKRLSYNELFLFSLALLDSKSRDTLESSFIISRHVEVDHLLGNLPFELTEGQIRTIREIEEDMTSGSIMNRLIQGDVGSGKTIISFVAMLDTALSHYQAALMAPTEILATQHYEKLTDLIDEHGLDVRVMLLVGSMSAKEKREAYSAIEKGEIDIIIGTHALFQDKVKYRNLALVVTDEQHRFGVLQRKGLTDKGMRPHNLIMSATPIPRTLALLLYIDVKVSRITELPKSRLPIKNALIDEDYRNRAYKFIYDEIKKGRQAYIICSMVEKNDTIELRNVEEEVPLLRKIFPSDVKISGLHGKMPAKQKEKIMEDFLNREIDILVSTTVVEVGVDVPNATVMLIENAERFGLAQLHQLRGRVGRSHHQSYCMFMDAKKSKVSKERLSILSSSNDGFHIAEEDLRLRGPGDIFGVRQSGELNFSVSDIYRDKDILEKASEDAKLVLARDPELVSEENRVLKERLEKFKEHSDTL